MTVRMKHILWRMIRKPIADSMARMKLEARLRGGVSLLLLSIVFGAPSYAQIRPQNGIDLQDIESLLRQNRIDDARSKALGIVEHDPANADAWDLLGTIQANQQDFTSAASSFKRALRIKPNSARTHNHLGGLYAAQNQLETAQNEFRAALLVDPRNRDAHYNLGVLLMKSSPAASIVHLSQVRPPDTASRIQLVRAYFQNKQSSLALKAAADLSSLDERDVQVHFSLGVILASEKQYKPAQLEFEKADALSPGTFEILFNLGQDLLRIGDYAKAQAVLARALREHPDSPETLYLLAQVYSNQSRPLDALDVLMHAHKAAPDNPEILMLMAQISMSQNYFEDAIPLLESGLKIAPRRPDLLAALGESYFMAGKVDKAIDEFNLLIEIEHSARSYAFLGLSYRNVGRFDQAKQQFEQGLKLDPHNSLCIFNLGFIAGRQGNSAAAETFFQNALHANPDFPDALLELANLRIATKRFAEAADYLRRYVLVSHDPATGYYKLAMVERNLHQMEAADRDLSVFKTLSRNSSSGPYPYQHLFDYLDNRSKLGPEARDQLDVQQLTEQITRHPDQPEDLYLLAETYLKAGNTDAARETIAKLDKLSAGDFKTLTGLGVLLARYHLYDSAIEHLQAALVANPDSDEVSFDLADALFRAHRFPEALEAAKRVPAAGQEDGAYLALLADIYAHLGDIPNASEIYRKAIQRNPDNDQDYLSLALIQLRGNDLVGAKRTLAEGQRRVPGSGKIFWGLGLIATLEGDNAGAGEQFERAVDLLPEWPGGYSTLGVFYYQSGQLEKAREVLNRFKNSSGNSLLDTSRIEAILDQSPTVPASTTSMSSSARAQFLQLAISLADRTL